MRIRGNDYGLGDAVKAATAAVGIKPCEGCSKTFGERVGGSCGVRCRKKRSSLVDVTGLEPATPCLQSRKSRLGWDCSG
jgi:hypothetical protein